MSCRASFPIADGIPNLSPTSLTSEQSHVRHDWDAMADQYHEVIQRIGTRATRIDRPLLEIATGSVVEVGCGDGRFLEKLRSRGVLDAIGIDISLRMASLAKRGGHRVVVAPAEALPFADRSVDCCLSGFYSLRYADLDRALGEFGRVLRPGGRFGFTLLGARAAQFSAAIAALPQLWSRESRWSAAEILFGRAVGIVLRNDVRDVATLRAQCAAAGLTIDRILGYARVPRASSVLDRVGCGSVPVPARLLTFLSYDIVVVGHRSLL